MNADFLNHLNLQLQEIKDAGLYKRERIISSPQSPRVTLKDGTVLLNLCANNYLGLADHPEIKTAAREGIAKHGYGLASVRFICGTQNIHKELESVLSEFLGTGDTILYSSCFDANGGLFEPLLGAEDAVISDELNHASIIDGIRLCKAKRFRYRNSDMDDLTAKLEEAGSCRFKLIATDGVFSMTGGIARLREICSIAEKYQALVMVDDSHAVGFIGKNGKGTPELCGVTDKVDIITGTLGKALGGASGGYVSGRKEIIEMLRQRSRPYLFSNTVPPGVICAALKAIEMVRNRADLRQKLNDNTRLFRKLMSESGFDLTPGEHPIIPVMLGDALKAQRMAEILLANGVYVIGFSYPVVPHGQARIRTQISAAHTSDELVFAAKAFSRARDES